VKDAGTYTIQPTGLESNNYEINYNNGTWKWIKFKWRAKF
jgi:hypothetical protein